MQRRALGDVMLVAYLFVMAVRADGPTRLLQHPLASLRGSPAASSTMSTNGFDDPTLQASRVWHWHAVLTLAETLVAYMTLLTSCQQQQQQQQQQPSTSTFALSAAPVASASGAGECGASGGAGASAVAPRRRRTRRGWSPRSTRGRAPRWAYGSAGSDRGRRSASGTMHCSNVMTST